MAMRDPDKIIPSAATQLTADEIAEMRKQYRDWFSNTFSFEIMGKKFTPFEFITNTADNLWNEWGPKALSCLPWLREQFGNLLSGGMSILNGLLQQAMGFIQSRTDPEGYKFSQALRQANTKESITAALEAGPIAGMGKVADAITNPYAAILSTISSATLTDAGIAQAKDSIQVTLYNTLSDELKKVYGTDPAVDQAARGLMASMRDGVEQYLRAIKTIKETPGLSQSDIQTRIAAVKLEFGPLNDEGTQGARGLLALVQNRATARSDLLADIRKELGTDATPSQIEIVERMLTGGGIKLEQIRQIVDALDKGGWDSVFRTVGATGIAVTQNGGNWRWQLEC